MLRRSSGPAVLRCLVLAACLGGPAALLAAPPMEAGPPVEAVALFKDRALLRGAGGDHLLAEGETSPDGVTLLEADAAGARVRYRGEVYELSLSRRVAGRFQQAERQQVAINRDASGQYRIRGSINGSYVDFLVDTGASVVAMSRAHANRLGIDATAGRPGAVQTAQGVIGSRFVTLDEVVVGGIRAHNVDAAIIDGSYPVEILLGMSFLRQVSMQESGGVLTLVAQH